MICPRQSQLLGGKMESRIHVNGGEMFLRHSEILSDRATLLFIHGLGESGRCFDEAYQDSRFSGFNILIPDMLGYGKSSDARDEDYSLNLQVNRIWEIIDKTGVKELNVIGHSLGGDLATLLCNSDEKRIIRKCVNIEGDITQYDDFITREAVEAEKKNDFENWFIDRFMNDLVLNQWGKAFPSCLRYYESLKLCRTQAFRENALELYALKNAIPGRYKSQLGKIYASLAIPNVFCYGTKSIDERSMQFLRDNNLRFEEFTEAGHWVMIDQSEKFYSSLLEFLSAK